METEPARRALDDALAEVPHLRVLVLHGSRARGTHHARSDWDLGFLADDGLDPLALRDLVATTLGTDDVDLVDLDQASGLLRFAAARDGLVIIARPSGAWERFVLDATLFWCDAGAVITGAHEAVLAELAR